MRSSRIRPQGRSVHLARNSRRDVCLLASHLLLRADVQSPQLCLLNCELLLPELYMGVAAEGTVTLFNQTLLPSNFSWAVRVT